MSRRHFERTDNAELRAKIAEAKQRLAMPELLARLGLAEHAKKRALCPFHSDEHPSFSVFQKKDGTWWHRCFVGCTDGDEREAIKLYLEMAGFPPRVHPKPHEWPKSHEYPKSLACPESPMSPEYPVSLVYPMSNGQGLEKELEGIAATNACTERGTARKRRWQLARDLRALEKRLCRKLSPSELMRAFNEWFRLSQAFLDPAKTRDSYLAAFLAELSKVRVPTGEGETIKNALEYVSTLPASELPVIPRVADAPESWRRVAALHRELCHRSANKTYYLSCRDAAKAWHGLSKSSAANINRALAQLAVIEIVRIGDARPNGKASSFRYLLRQTENRMSQAENETDKARPIADTW